MDRRGIIDSEGANNWETGLFVSFNTPFSDPEPEGNLKGASG